MICFDPERVKTARDELTRMSDDGAFVEPKRVRELLREAMAVGWTLSFDEEFMPPGTEQVAGLIFLQEPPQGWPKR